MEARTSDIRHAGGADLLTAFTVRDDVSEVS